MEKMKEQRNREVVPHAFKVKHILYNLKTRRNLIRWFIQSIPFSPLRSDHPGPVWTFPVMTVLSFRRLYHLALHSSAALKVTYIEVKATCIDFQVELIIWTHLSYSNSVLPFQPHFLPDMDSGCLSILSVFAWTSPISCFVVWFFRFVG